MPSAAVRRLPALRKVCAVVALTLVAAACGGGSKQEAATPTLLTVPDSSTTAGTAATTTSTAPAGEATADTQPTVDSGATSDPSSSAPTNPELPGQTTTPGAVPVPSSTAPTATAGTVLATSTTVDIERPNPPLATSAPIATSPEPPTTIGGVDTDYLIGPRSVAGVQFGASMQTVLDRVSRLLGQPLTVQEGFAECANGTATAIQWYALGVIITDRGFQYFNVGMATDMYEGLPVPGWHTSAGVTVGAMTPQIQAAYPNQVAIDGGAGGFASFDVTGGADAGLSGQLFNDALQSLSGGSSEC